jgi:outer membrane protein assembly factor BamE
LVFQIVLRMKKILISLLIALSSGLVLQGCSSLKDFSLVYVPDIQQGNIVTPEMVAELKTGMSKRQVRFVLGTPTLIDVFHQDRWDYTFSLKQRNLPAEIKHFSVFFVDDSLDRYAGDIKPAKNPEKLKDKKEIVLSVPDYDKQQDSSDKEQTADPLDILNF